MHSVKSLRDSQLFSNSLPMGVSLLLPLERIVYPQLGSVQFVIWASHFTSKLTTDECSKLKITVFFGNIWYNRLERWKLFIWQSKHQQDTADTADCRHCRHCRLYTLQTVDTANTASRAECHLSVSEINTLPCDSWLCLLGGSLPGGVWGRWGRRMRESQETGDRRLGIRYRR